METNQKSRTTRFSTTLLTMIIVVSLVIGGLVGYSASNLALSGGINDLQNQLSTLQEHVSNLQSTQNIVNQNNTYILAENASLSQLYEQVKDSVVIIRGIIVQYDIFHRPYYTQVQGSGFVYNFTGEIVIIKNYHVVQDTVNVTITFVNGNGYAATVLGSDAYADLAVLSTDAPQSEYRSLDIVSSSTLKVGDPVIAVGNPYGLAGSMTTGIVSALGRTITEDMSGGYPIADCIQTTAPINPGNSGGPLLDYQGRVVGITTAIVSDSQGLGFAIPSNTILRETESLIVNGSFDQHPWLGATGTDMTYEIAEVMNTNVTCGWLIAQITADGPSAKAGLQGGTQQVSIAGKSAIIGGDIVTAINTTSMEKRITSMDDLSTLLEEYTSPNQTVNITIVRNNQTLTLPVKLGT
ncbi:trypsin-like peptidase domain-containing protein, partial [Candidatus Bathyarchaeota archaeon]|nr:trypsin-like peptidase domain-containing protein [Candidatus Bathyarchaeota archaeon]